MLRKKRHETLTLALTVIGQGDKIKFNVTYNNLRTTELTALQENPDFTMGQMVLAMVKSWECEYELSIEGLTELEEDRPGMIEALIAGYNEARRMSKTKN